MYCTNCSCHSCVALRVTASGYDRVKENVIRLISKHGERGLTLAELRTRSRPLRTMSDEDQALMLDGFVASGDLLRVVFEPEARRGRSRDAFVMAQVSQ